MGCRFKCGYTNCNKKRYNLRTLKSHIKLDHGPQFIYTTIVQCLPCEYSGYFASLKESHPDKYSTCPGRNSVTSKTNHSSLPDLTIPHSGSSRTLFAEPVNPNVIPFATGDFSAFLTDISPLNSSGSPFGGLLNPDVIPLDATRNSSAFLTDASLPSLSGNPFAGLVNHNGFSYGALPETQVAGPYSTLLPDNSIENVLTTGTYLPQFSGSGIFQGLPTTASNEAVAANDIISSHISKTICDDCKSHEWELLFLSTDYYNENFTEITKLASQTFTIKPVIVLNRFTKNFCIVEAFIFCNPTFVFKSQQAIKISLKKIHWEFECLVALKLYAITRKLTDLVILLEHEFPVLASAECYWLLEVLDRLLWMEGQLRLISMASKYIDNFFLLIECLFEDCNENILKKIVYELQPFINRVLQTADTPLEDIQNLLLAKDRTQRMEIMSHIKKDYFIPLAKWHEEEVSLYEQVAGDYADFVEEIGFTLPQLNSENFDDTVDKILEFFAASFGMQGKCAAEEMKFLRHENSFAAICGDLFESKSVCYYFTAKKLEKFDEIDELYSLEDLTL